MNTTRYGVRWPDGSVTGGITDKESLARAYAREHGGTVYKEGGEQRDLLDNAQRDEADETLA